MLARYWTGVPTADPVTKGAMYKRIAQGSPQPTTALPDGSVRHCYIAPMVRRIAKAVCTDPGVMVDWGHRADGWFDAWVARRVDWSRVDGVIGYENSALHTFKAARRRGLPTILDAASFHHAWQDQHYTYVESDAVHARINRRKDEEIAQADHILTVSELARQSYLAAGVPADRVTSVPMGATLKDFAPSPKPVQEDVFTFLFVGQAGPRKGMDLLLQAARQLSDNGLDFNVQVAGGIDASMQDAINEASAVQALGYLGRPALVEALQAADCLVLPSRHDSFGRVVVEALATGTPVLVSEHVGAKEVITEDVTGWTVPAEDAGALADRMRWCITHRGEVRAMRDDAVQTAQQYSWAAYRKRVVDVIRNILD